MSEGFGEYAATAVAVKKLVDNDELCMQLWGSTYTLQTT